MSPPPQQQQQQRRPWRTPDGWTILGYVVLLVAGPFVAWLNPPPLPRFTIDALSISGGGQVAFNVTDSDPNRYMGISYKGVTRASLLSDDATVASGHANRSSTSITGVLDVIDEPTVKATIRDCHPLRLQLTTAISFRLLNVFPSVEQNMYVNCDLLVGADGSLLRLRKSVGHPATPTSGRWVMISYQRCSYRYTRAIY